MVFTRSYCLRHSRMPIILSAASAAVGLWSLRSHTFPVFLSFSVRICWERAAPTIDQLRNRPRGCLCFRISRQPSVGYRPYAVQEGPGRFPAAGIPAGRSSCSPGAGRECPEKVDRCGPMPPLPPPTWRSAQSGERLADPFSAPLLRSKSCRSSRLGSTVLAIRYADRFLVAESARAPLLHVASHQWWWLMGDI